MQKQASRALALLLVFSFLFPFPSFAQFKLRDAIKEFGEKRFVETTPGKHLQAGPVKIHPKLDTRMSYDSNILLENEDARQDIVFDIQPGAILELPIQTHQLVMGYEADFELFTKRRHRRQSDQNQNFFSLIDLNFPDWYINVLEDFKETSSRSGTTFTERIPRFENSINPKIGYRWNRFTFEQGFRHFVRDFRRQVDDPFDFQEIDTTSVIYYDLFAKLKALVDYQFAQLDYDDSASRAATINQARIGLEGEIYRNIFFKTRIGPQFRNYHDRDENDFYSWVANVGVDYKMRENLKLMLYANREPVEATFLNVNYYKQHTIGTGFEYALNSKWIFVGDVQLRKHDYAERTSLGGLDTYRRDKSITISPALRYLIHPSWALELGYQYIRRDSNFGSLSYTDHVAYLNSKLSY